MNVRELAILIHNMNIALCKALEEAPQAKWGKTDDSAKAALIFAVEYRLDNPQANNEQNHDVWCDRKKLEGWTVGPKDLDAKTHPRLVPWNDLSKESQVRYAVVEDTVKRMAAFVDRKAS